MRLAHSDVFEEIVRKEEESKKVKAKKECAKWSASLKYHHQSMLKESSEKKIPSTEEIQAPRKSH